MMWSTEFHISYIGYKSGLSWQYFFDDKKRREEVVKIIRFSFLFSAELFLQVINDGFLL